MRVLRHEEQALTDGRSAGRLGFDEAAAVKRGLEECVRRQRLKNLQPFLLEGARARAAGSPVASCPYGAKAARQGRTWWRTGWGIMDESLCGRRKGA